MYNGPNDLSQDAFDRANDQEDCTDWEDQDVNEIVELLPCGHIGIKRDDEFCPQCYADSLEDHNSL
jgi:hypothetical protein